MQWDLALGAFIVTGTAGSGKNKAVPTINSAVLLGGHRHNHDEHGSCSHDRIGICCCHNKLLQCNDVQCGAFTPAYANFFNDKRHVVGIGRLMAAGENERARATDPDWAE